MQQQRQKYVLFSLGLHTFGFNYACKIELHDNIKNKKSKCVLIKCKNVISQIYIYIYIYIYQCYESKSKCK